MSERLRLVPPHNCLFTPELQRQPRGKWRILPQGANWQRLLGPVHAASGCLLSGGADGSITVWDVGSSRVLRVLRAPHKGPVSAMLVLESAASAEGEEKAAAERVALVALALQWPGASQVTLGRVLRYHRMDVEAASAFVSASDDESRGERAFLIGTPSKLTMCS